MTRQNHDLWRVIDGFLLFRLFLKTIFETDLEWFQILNKTEKEIEMLYLTVRRSSKSKLAFFAHYR